VWLNRPGVMEGLTPHEDDDRAGTEEVSPQEWRERAMLLVQEAHRPRHLDRGNTSAGHVVEPDVLKFAEPRFDNDRASDAC